MKSFYTCLFILLLKFINPLSVQSQDIIKDLPGIDIVTDYYQLINANIENMNLHPSITYIESQQVQGITDEFGGFFNEEGNIIFASEVSIIGYTAENEQNLDKAKYFDLYSISFDGENFGLKKRLPGDINTAEQEGPAYIYYDETKMLYTQSYLDTDLKKRKLRVMQANFDGKKWVTEKQILPDFPGSVAHAALSLNEEILVFSGTLDSRYGKPDLYYTTKDSNGNWQEPEAFSSVVNTSGREVFPTFYTNNDIIFSSDGHPDGYGGLDFYALNIADIENPVIKHLPGNINSPKNEYFLRFSYDKSYGIFTSNRKGKGDDLFIFKFEESMTHEFTAVGNIYLTILDLITEKQINNARIIIKDKDKDTVLLDKKLEEVNFYSFRLNLTIPFISITVEHGDYYTYYEVIDINKFKDVNKTYNIYIENKGQKNEAINNINQEALNDNKL